jgi:phage shock protein C
MARAARRAERLAQRAKERADRKVRRATEAADRAEELARRAARQASRRSRDMERSIEDLVDDVTDRWTRKAEGWIERTREELLGEDADVDDDLMDDELATGMANDGYEASGESRRSRRSHRARSRRHRSTRSRVRSFRHRLRNGRSLYRDPEAGKIFGVCAGIAEYYNVEAWQIRLAAILGLIFLPSITFTGYFIAYFLMDKKPYYLRMAGDAEEFNRNDAAKGKDPVNQRESRRNRQARYRSSNTQIRMTNAQALKVAKSSFADLEKRLRRMESHVTDSRFELQRELRKISGEN